MNICAMKYDFCAKHTIVVVMETLFYLVRFHSINLIVISSKRPLIHQFHLEYQFHLQVLVLREISHLKGELIPKVETNLKRPQ